MTTNYLVEKSKGILKLVPEYRDEGKGYQAFNDGSVEAEVGDFLYGMTRILRPVFVLETGTYKGVSSAYIGQALKDNGRGTLDTCEINDLHIETAKQLWATLEIFPKWIKPHRIESLKYEAIYNYDLMFLDSEPNLRFHELVRFYPHLSEGGYAFIHDCPPSLTQGNINPDHPEIESWPFCNLPEEIKTWVKEDKLRVIHFPNPRGMTGFYRVRRDEYKWL